MTASYDYDGTPLARVRRGSVELTQCAENMTVGTGRLVYDDTPGTLDIVGQMDFAADEDACANPITARGFIGPRGYSRQSERKSLAREIDIEFQDLNAMAGFRLIGSGGQRPAETVAARGAWLMGSAYVTGLFTDEGRCSFPALDMDKADYRNQFPGDVISDMVLASLGFNAYIREFGDGPELVFRNDNTSTADTIDLRVSNVISDVTGDITGLTFYPMKDAVLRRDPSQVISKLAYSYAKGTAVRTRVATATAFNGERGGTASNANVKTLAMANDEGDEVLWQRSTEEDTIECTIQVPSSAVNLVSQGDRMQARFSHLTPEGYGSMTWFRVLEATKSPLLRPVGKYNVRLRLSPQEAAPPAPVCGEDATPSDTYYPLGGSGNIPNVSDGVVYYWRAGFTYPTVPTPGLQGSWHFPAYSAGGLGTIDYMGDCAANRLLFMVVGNGTLEVQTESYGGTLRGVVLVVAGVTVDSGTSGDVLTYEVDDTSEGDCIRVIEFRDSTWPTCGSKVGWSQMDWAAA